MYDIIFLSYNEANADANWANLKARFPRAQRVHGVKGIVEAHQAAAAKCDTKWFWVVDADNVVDPDFDFSFKWSFNHQQPTSVAVWRARNNVNGLVYGYGGIKLLPRRRVLEMNSSVVDFTTSIGGYFNVIDVVASTTVINGTPFEAWKSGFREAAKLASSVIHRQNPAETIDRLNVWCSVANGDYAAEVLAGANAGRAYGEEAQGDHELLRKLNDFSWLQQQFDNYRMGKVADPEPQPPVGSFRIPRGLEDLYPDKPFLQSLRKTMDSYPDARWEDTLSHGQVMSKRWLTEKLIEALWFPLENPEARPHWMEDPEYYLSDVYLCCSWYGTLAEVMLDQIGADRFGQIVGMDIDPHAVEVANRLMKHWVKDWKFKSTVKDIHDLTFDNDTLMFLRGDGETVERQVTPSMIVNTSCEHIENFDQWYGRIPAGRFVVMQSNDYFEWREHVNCSENLAAFAKQTPLRYELFSGELTLEKYTRFMRIGIR